MASVQQICEEREMQYKSFGIPTQAPDTAMRYVFSAGYSPIAKIPATFACQASLPNFGRGMRTQFLPMARSCVRIRSSAAKENRPSIDGLAERRIWLACSKYARSARCNTSRLVFPRKRQIPLRGMRPSPMARVRIRFRR